MADVNRGRRPLSPHLTIYRGPLAMWMSISHRVTGVGLGLAAILVVWWFGAAATDADYFATVDGLLTSWLGVIVLFFCLVAFWYHFCNGIRHLIWDTGYGMDIPSVERSGYVVLGATAALTLLTLLALLVA